MTATSNYFTSTVCELSTQLRSVSSPIVRIDLIDRLLHYLVYTQPDWARSLLEEQASLLLQHPLPDQQLSHYFHLSALDNLGYRFEAAEAALLQALNLIEEYGSIQQRVDALIDHAGTLINLDRQEEAEGQLSKADRLLQTFPNDQLYARLLSRQGGIQLRNGQYSKAIQKYLNAFSYQELSNEQMSLKDHYFYTLVNAGLGNVYERMGEYDKAEEAYRRAIQRCESLGLVGRLAWYYLNLGNAHLSTGQYEEAAKYLNLSLENDDDASGSARESAYANLGSCYIQQGRFREAEELLERAATFFKNADKDYQSNLATIAIWRAQIKVEEGDTREGIQLLEEARSLAESSGDLIILSEVHQNLADCYAMVKDFESAYYAQLTYDEYQRQHQEVLNHRRTRELETLYRTEAKEKEAERLKLMASHLQLNALRAQMNPHFLYNCLNSIQSFITTKDANTASKYLAKFAMLMRQSLEYTNKENISLEDEIAFVSDYLDISCHLRFDGKLAYTIEVDDELEEDIVGVPTMIIQPYVENAIEHGLRGRKGGNIHISFRPYDDTAILATITDNGIGREKVAAIQAGDPLHAAHRSRGTEITMSRLKLLQPLLAEQEPVKIIDLFDKNGIASGTRVEVLIPSVDLHLVGLKN